MTTEEFKKIIMQKKIDMHDEDNIFPPPTSDAEGLQILIKHFLGYNWYVIDPLGHEQLNTEAIYEILSKYPNAEQEQEKRRKKKADFFHRIIDKMFKQ